nr:phospholipase A1-like isoform X1 [Onthophagus taurus]
MSCGKIRLAAAIAAYLIKKKQIKKKKTKRSVWVKNWVLRGVDLSFQNTLLEELRTEDSMQLKNFLKISNDDFEYILSLIQTSIQKQDTKMRLAIPPKDRLLVTLRFLATDGLTVLNRTQAIPNIYFYLYNKDSGVNGLEFRIDNINTALIPIKNINIVLIHGWTESHTRPHYLKIRDEYLKKYDCNVFSFDYNRLDQQGYTYAREIAPDVGELIAETLVFLKYSGKLNFDQVHVVSHSLGCHVAGFVGKNVFRLSNEKLAKITALDAAGPNYNGAPPEKRLTGTDAKSTVVIHTDGLIFGANENMGTLDIYFNPLRPLQPGCTVAEIITDHGQAYCNHWISYKYFINTINKPQYIAIECSSAIFYVFGLCFNNRQILYTEDINPEITGTYFVSAESPFGINIRNVIM